MNDTNPKPSPRARWRFGFRLRSLFLLTALVACPLGYVVYERHRCAQQERAINICIPFKTAEAESVQLQIPGYTESGEFAVRTGFWAALWGDNRGDQIIEWELPCDPRGGISKSQMYSLSYLSNLKCLALPGSKVESGGFKFLSALYHLESLTLRETSITDNDLYYLSGLKKLTLLKLNNTNISDAGAPHLAPLTNLKHLDLHQTKITDASLKHFAKMPNLEYLDLSDTEVSEKSIEALAKHTHLKVLALPPESFSPAARTKIRKLLPNCDIIFATN